MPRNFKVLDGVALVARKYDKTIIEVAGHTVNVGAADYNKHLSRRRATAVAQYLVSRGVADARIMTAAGGEDHPIASNSTEQGRAANRRVEVTLVLLTAGWASRAASTPSPTLPLRGRGGVSRSIASSRRAPKPMQRIGPDGQGRGGAVCSPLTTHAVFHN